MLTKETVVYGPRAPRERPDREHDERVCVEMRDRGCRIEMFFADLSGQGPVLEVRLKPDGDELNAGQLRELMPQAPLYAQYARAEMNWDHAQVAEMAAALREIGATRRGLPDEFYRLVAEHHRRVRAEGERYPIKALAAIHHVTISAASRWVTEARRRGYIDEAGDNA